jgi:carbamoylphosphate synthase small subunit
MATAHAAAREHERTREWLENKGLPKVARVAQREAYNVLRQFGVMAQTKPSHAEVGRNEYASSVPHKLADNEVMELAEACVSMLEAKGQAVEITLSEMSVTAGGFLLLEDAIRVREKAATFLADKSTS